jgi:hypothetical protein
MGLDGKVGVAWFGRYFFERREVLALLPVAARLKNTGA